MNYNVCIHVLQIKYILPVTLESSPQSQVTQAQRPPLIGTVGVPAADGDFKYLDPFPPSHLPPGHRRSFQEGRGSQSGLINLLHSFIMNEKQEDRQTSKLAKVIGTMSGDLVSMLVSGKFRKIGMKIGDLARIAVSEATIVIEYMIIE